MRPSPPPPSCSVIRGIFRCSLFIGMVGFVAAAIGAHALWRKTDKFVESALLKQIQERVPDWDLTFASAKADWSGKVRVKEIILNGADGRPLMEVPEMVLELDMDLLLGSQKVLVKRARINDPIIRIRCDDATRWRELTAWNIDLPSPRPSETAPPDLIVENAAVLVQMPAGDGNTASDFRAAGIHVSAIPDSRHGYTTEITGQIQHVGRIEVHASSDFAHGTMAVKGRCDQIDLQGIVQTILGVSPTARDQVATLTVLSERARRNRAVQLASGGAPEAALEPQEPTGNALEDLGLHADMSVEFNLARSRREAPLTYSVIAEIRDGQVTNPNIPAPLYGLKGHIAANQDGLVVRNLMASNGDRKLNIDGHWEFRGQRPERRFTFQASELSIGPEVRSYLPPPIQVRYDQLRPEGKFKVDVEYNSAFEGTPIKLRELSVVDGVVQHEMFPYRVAGIRGGVRQDGSRFELDFHGQANGRTVTLKGALESISPDAAMQLVINVPQLPIDSDLLRAFAESKLPGLVKLYPVLSSLNASGVADWDVQLARAAGTEKFLLTRLEGKVARGALNYDRFPYYVSDLTGLVEFDRTQGDVWWFKNLRGVHGSDSGATQISGQGSFAVQPAPGRLNLTLNALNLPLDLDLQSASVKAVPEMSKAWEELVPTGSADVTGLTIGWSPGQPTQLELPSIQLKDVRIRPKHLPYAWEHLNCAAKWKGRRVIVRSLQAYHDQSYINIDAGGRDDEGFAYFEINPGPSPSWRLHLQELTIKKLLLDDDELRSALPAKIRTVAAHVRPTQPFDLRLGIDLKGSLTNEVVTAHWTTEATLHGGDITLGVPMKDVRGVIGITSGTFDGEKVEGVGSAAFDQATILALPFKEVQAPFRLQGSLVSIGAPSWDKLEPSKIKPRFAGRSLKAALYGGEVSVDATANIDPVDSERSTYAMQLDVKGVKLHAIAQANQLHERLYGDIRAVASLRGVGSDAMKLVTDDRTKNWVQIQPARLLDLPIFIKLFKLIAFDPGENFMFSSAEGEFRIKNGMFDFTSIKMEGDSIGFIGSGTVGFISHALDLQFLHRARSPLPVLKQLANVLGRDWIAISVRGTVEDPVVNQQAQLPILTPAIRMLMDQSQMRPVSRPAGR